MSFEQRKARWVLKPEAWMKLDIGRVEIVLSDVSFYCAQQVWQGNIVDHVRAHPITDANIEDVIAELVMAKSGQFDEAALRLEHEAGRLVGRTYVGVTPVYGAVIDVVCGGVEEITHSAR